MSLGDQALAFALLFECYDEDVAEGNFEEFASDFIAAPPDSWVLASGDVEAWLKETLRAGGLAEKLWSKDV